jgi:hypothetical protein
MAAPVFSPSLMIISNVITLNIMMRRDLAERSKFIKMYESFNYAPAMDVISVFSACIVYLLEHSRSWGRPGYRRPVSPGDVNVLVIGD